MTGTTTIVYFRVHLEHEGCSPSIHSFMQEEQAVAYAKTRLQDNPDIKARVYERVVTTTEELVCIVEAM